MSEAKKAQEKIDAIELEISRTQINKATMHHICLLKARLARAKREVLEAATKKIGSPGQGWEVKRSGDARIGLFGFPSVGKSTLLNALTGQSSKVAAYEFTTLTPIPGILNIHGAKIQILDLPGILEGAADGVGRGKQVISIARTCSLILMVLDGMKSLDLVKILEKELAGYGIKLNKSPPKIRVDIRDRNGYAITSSVPQPYITEELVEEVMRTQYRIQHAVVHFDQEATIDDLIDVLEGNRVYIKCIYVINKCDQLWPEYTNILAKRDHTMCVSAFSGYNLKNLVDKIWSELSLIRVYTQPKGCDPDPDPLVLSSDRNTIEDFCNKIHTSIVERFKLAWVTGKSVKHSPGQVGLRHQLMDGDTVTLILTG